MAQRDQQVSENDRLGNSYRLAHPVRYSGFAAVLAGIVAAPLDLLFFDQPLWHGIRVGISSAITWFVVLLVMSFSQRVKVQKTPR